jgi:hypothetical protein
VSYPPHRTPYYIQLDAWLFLPNDCGRQYRISLPTSIATKTLPLNSVHALIRKSIYQRDTLHPDISTNRPCRNYMFTFAPTMIDAPFKTTLIPVRAHGVVYLTKQYLLLQEVYVIETTVTGRYQSGGEKLNLTQF